MNNVYNISTGCLECTKKLTGRFDKKFCDDYCRNTYNNKVKRISERGIISVNSKIRKNRTILKTLCPSGKATVRKEVMVAMGYDFNYFSSIYHTKRGVYYLCYEFGFCAIRERNIEKALIIQRQKYMTTYNPWSYAK